jgi:hypothetical protein
MLGASGPLLQYMGHHLFGHAAASTLQVLNIFIILSKGTRLTGYRQEGGILTITSMNMLLLQSRLRNRKVKEG